jgi:tRNA dimethylallyltransferase
MRSGASVLVLTGATAVGKTALAIKAAYKLGFDIISADSRQIYRFLDIGTAKPSAEEQRHVRHYLIDIIEPGGQYSAAAFARDARTIMDRLDDERRGYLVAGGSGLYIKALVEGLSDIPPVDPKIIRRLSQEASERGLDSLYRRLFQNDPKTASKLKPADRARIIRALGVLEATGNPISLWQERPRRKDGRKYKIVVLDRERSELYRRIEKRVDKMVSDGLIDEVRWLIRQGWRQALEQSKAVGYREAMAHLDGLIDCETMKDVIKQNTRRFAKRQLTWFRGMKETNWLDISRSNGETESLIYKLASQVGV